MSALLTVAGLETRYGKVAALQRAALEVAPGQIVTVIGANGAGKSTLLNSLMGLLPVQAKTTGEIHFKGRRIDRWGIERRVLDGLALVPERRELFGTLSVEDNLRLGAFTRYRQRDREWDSQLKTVYGLFPRLEERRAQLAGTLSGGERQMLALGRALMGRPQLLMLDEPSLGLAPRIVREIFSIIASLRATGVSVLLVEQNARAALQVADYGYVLETGEVTIHGAATSLATDPRVIESYLGVGRKAVVTGA